VTYWFLLGITAACLAVIWVLVKVHNNIMSDTLATLAVTAGIICGVGAFFSGVGFLAANVDRHTCVGKGENTGIRVQYELLSGCYVHVDGRLIPYDKWVHVSGVGTP
jgi:hypothetical protein